MKERIIPALALVFLGATWFLYGFPPMLLAALFGACCFEMGSKEK